MLTGFSAAFYLLLCWVFADHQFAGDWWTSRVIAGSNVMTDAFLAAIVLGGLYQMLREPVAAVESASFLDDGCPPRTR